MGPVADYAARVLDDRPYMREQPDRGRLSTTAWLMILLTGVFMIQQVAYVQQWALDRHLALSPDALRRGFVWQFLTFQLLHDGLFHLLCNLLGIWFFGRVAEQRFGPGQFLALFFGAGMTGGLLQVLLSWSFPQHFGQSVIGSSAGVLALLAVFCLLEPEAQILFMFILPLKAKHMLYITTGISLFFTVVPAERGIAHAAHLGGIMAGALYLRWQLHAFDPAELWRQARQPKGARELVRAGGGGAGRPGEEADAEELPPGEFISREVDPILDKISAHGIQSLTEQERKVLDRARARMARRG